MPEIVKFLSDADYNTDGGVPTPPAGIHAYLFARSDGLYIKLADGTVYGPLASRQAWTDMHDPTGFVERTTSTLTWTDGTRTLQIAPTGTSFPVYTAGVKLLKTTTSKQISTDVGMHYIYFDTAGVIQESTTVWDINSANVPIASVYWNGSAGLLMDERHGCQMDGETHEYLHETRGSSYAFGLDGTFGADGSAITIAAGEWYDEDIEYTPTQQTQCRVFWLDGTTWKWTAAQNGYFHTVSSVPQNNIAGALGDVGVAKYSISWVYTSNITSTPTVVIMAQAAYNTQAEAEAASVPNLTTLPASELVLLYRVIWQRNSAVIAWKRTDDYRRVVGGPASSYNATDHGALTGLSDNDHPQYNHYPCEGRLTLESGVPISTTDQATKATLYFTPFRGNKLALYDGSAWVLRTLTEISISLAAATASKPYDVFVYDNAGTPTLEILVWTNASTRATALTTQDGILVKTGALTRRYLGTIYINASGGQTDDSLIKRNVWNYYNRASRRLYVIETTSHAYNGAVRLWNNLETNNRIEWITGVQEDAPTLYIRPTIKSGADGNYANVPLYVDGTGTSHGIINYNAQYIVGGVTFPYDVAAGYHYANAYELGDHASSTFANVIIGGSVRA